MGPASFFDAGLFIFWRGGGKLFEGVFEKYDVLLWCFCGEVVVKCVAKDGELMHVFES
jgi:hypothetical protein